MTGLTRHDQDRVYAGWDLEKKKRGGCVKWYRVDIDPGLRPLIWVVEDWLYDVLGKRYTQDNHVGVRMETCVATSKRIDNKDVDITSGELKSKT